MSDTLLFVASVCHIPCCLGLLLFVATSSRTHGQCHQTTVVNLVVAYSKEFPACHQTTVVNLVVAYSKECPAVTP